MGDRALKRVQAFQSRNRSYNTEGVRIADLEQLTKLMKSNRVKWGFSPERIKESVVRTPDGNYAAEYSPEIFLYLYVEPGDENLNYIALTFSVDTEASLKSADGESQYESLCRQLVFALEEGATNDTASELLTKLGLFGPVLDGVQRAERSGKFTYMTRYCESNIMLLIVPAL